MSIAKERRDCTFHCGLGAYCPVLVLSLCSFMGARTQTLSVARIGPDGVCNEYRVEVLKSWEAEMMEEAISAPRVGRLTLESCYQACIVVLVVDIGSPTSSATGHEEARFRHPGPSTLEIPADTRRAVREV